MNGLLLIVGVFLAMVGLIWLVVAAPPRKRADSDYVEVAGLAVCRSEVHRVDRKVWPGGRRDVVVHIGDGKTVFALSGEDADVFLAWWEPVE